MIYSKEIYDEISRRKTESERRLSAHLDDVRKNYPEIEALRLEKNLIAIDFADKIIASPGDTDSLMKLGKELSARKEAELRERLRANGLPEDYLEKTPACSVCGDTGAVDGELCGCMKKLLIEKRFKGSGLSPDRTFELFRHDLIEDPRESRALERIYAFCLEYAESFPGNALPDILLYGDPGVGKTFLLNAIGERVLSRGYSALRITANALVNEVLDCIAEHRKKPDLVMPDLLIIDDLGTEPMVPNVTIETLLSVICERQDMNRATLIATNKSLEMISAEYGNRIYSRLLTPQRVKVIKMTTPSIRFRRT